jgi:hypothetical protein
MRRTAFALILVACTVSAESPTVGQDGSITLSRERIEQMEKAFEAIANARERAAFEAGRADARERCASLVSR